MRLACARVVAALPESYRASCVDLVDTATAQLREDKDPDVRAVMRGDTEDTEEPGACDTVIPTFTSLDNVISEVHIYMYRVSHENSDERVFGTPCTAMLTYRVQNSLLPSGHRDSRKWAVKI